MNTSYKKITGKQLNKHSKVVNRVRYVDEGVHLLNYTQIDNSDTQDIGFLELLIKYNNSYNICYNGEESSL